MGDGADTNEDLAGRDRLREAMRWLLLPVRVEAEDEAVVAARAVLAAAGIEPDDEPAWIEMELADWRRTGESSDGLVAVATAYLRAGGGKLESKLAKKYFSLHARLAEEPLMDHDAASAVLSHARLIALLATEEGLSAGQVAKLVAARDERAPVTWSHVQRILSAVGAKPSLSEEEIQRVYATDEELEVEVFADAEEVICLEMVAGAGRRLGFPGNLFELLRTLVPPGEIPNGPYLQILHYQCTIAEHYDHALTILYEFTPRGEAAKSLFAHYPSTLEVKDSPFLNNTKSVDEMNRAWAKSKKRAYTRQAHALVGVVQGLDSMGFAARRELAAWLRRLLVRRIRLARDTEVVLPRRLSPKRAKALVESVSAGETGTRGILEQRLVDAVSSLRHPLPRWIPRGLLDSVNATNTSSRKCGDCDFQDTARRRVVAYEAHAGKLSDIYLDGHLRTLEAVLKRRLTEWEENVGPDLEWKVEIHFVAHELDVAEPPDLSIDGVTVKVKATTYDDFLSGLDCSDPAVQKAINRYVRDPLAAPRTPDSIRATLLSLLGV